MAQGIIRLTPKRGASGSLVITNVDPNTFGVKVGSSLTYSLSNIETTVGQTVNCSIISKSTCIITK